MERWKLQLALTLKYASSWTRKGWPTVRKKNSFSTSDMCFFGTIFRTNTSSLQLWPPGNFILASMTLPNVPLPRHLVILKSSKDKPLSSLWRSVAQTVENTHQIPVCILLTVSLKQRTIYNVRTSSNCNTLM